MLNFLKSSVHIKAKRGWKLFEIREIRVSLIRFAFMLLYVTNVEKTDEVKECA